MIKYLAAAAVGVFAILMLLGSLGGDPESPPVESGTASAPETQPTETAAASDPARPAEDEKAALVATTEDFGAAMKDGDYDRIIATIPEPVLAKMAEKFGVPVERIAPAMKGQMEEALATIEIVEFGMDAEGAEVQTTEDGTLYAIVDTRTLMKAEGSLVEAKTPTLAIQDGGTWHLVRVDNDMQREIIGSVYPGLKDVTFPAATMEAVEG